MALALVVEAHREPEEVLLALIPIGNLSLELRPELLEEPSE